MNSRLALLSAALLVGCASTPSSPSAPVAPPAPTPAAAPVAAQPPERIAPHLFVGAGAPGQRGQVCVRRGDSLACSPALAGAPADTVGIAESMMHHCLWTKGGDAYCAGYNKDGRVGNGTKSDSEPLTKVPGLKDVVAMSLGARTSCAVTRDGAAWCWGDDVSLSPRRVDGVDHVVALASGQEPYCFLRDDGSIVWQTYQKGPAPFAALTSMASLAGCQPSAVCGVRRDGTAACAPTGEFPREFPITQTNLSALHDVVQVASTASAACALLRGGAVRCWGDGLGKVLNANSVVPVADTSRTVSVPALSGAAELAAGGGQVCARMGDGSVACIDEGEPTATARVVIAP